MCMAVYVAGTGQHRGKTLVSLGLGAALCERGLEVRYMKPIGQRAVPCDDELVDEDVVLLQAVTGFAPDLPIASPVTLPHGYTTRFLRGGGDTESLRKRIRDCLREIERPVTVRCNCISTMSKCKAGTHLTKAAGAVPAVGDMYAPHGMAVSQCLTGGPSPKSGCSCVTVWYLRPINDWCYWPECRPNGLLSRTG